MVNSCKSRVGHSAEADIFGLPLKPGCVKHSLGQPNNITGLYLTQLPEQSNHSDNLQSTLRTKSAILPNRGIDYPLGSGTDKSQRKIHPIPFLTGCWFHLLLGMVHEWVNFITTYNIHWNKKGDILKQPFLPSPSLTPHPSPTTNSKTGESCLWRD